MPENKSKSWGYNLFFKDAPLISLPRKGYGWIPYLSDGYCKFYADRLPRLAVSPYRMTRIKHHDEVKLKSTLLLWAFATPLLLPLTLATSCLAIALGILLAAISPITFLIAGVHDASAADQENSGNNLGL